MLRRDFLQIAAAQAAFAAGTAVFPAYAQEDGAAGDPESPTPAAGQRAFGFSDVLEAAQARASADYVWQKSTLVGSFADLNYDQYRAIRFRKDMDPWRDLGNFSMDLLPPGLIFYEPVQISVITDGVARKLPFAASMLEFDELQFPDGADTETLGDMGWSGFRLRTPLNRPDVMDEFLVFQGASYFRAVARGTLYGLSARGLAINTASPDGEEFPLFTDFWIRTPDPDATSVRIYAILDSKSVAGAFQFDITPGTETVIRTRMALFPRVEVSGVGIAPLTSMFWFGPASRAGIDDYRPAVHDSDGLQMVTGAGQRLWRSLSAHPKLQISSFVDRDPRGFGLAQRERSFDAYQDAEARYDERPSAWIEPIGDWGEGQVRLIEIPVENEFNDNIVSYWMPADPLKPGRRHDFSYRLTFSALPGDDAPLARVLATRSGKPVNDKTGRSVIIDFQRDLFLFGQPVPQVNASSGEIANVHLVDLPDENILRLAFLFRPGSDTVSDLSAVLMGPEGPLSEKWLARWSR